MIVIDHIFSQITEEYTRSLFIEKVLSSSIVSVNNRDTKDTQINMFVQTVSAQLLLQIEIITPSSIVPVNGTEFSIVRLWC